VAVAVVDVRVDSSAAVRNLQQLDQASKNSQASISALTGKVAGLAASLAAGFALSRIVSDVKDLDRNIRRLGTVGVDVAKINPALSKLSDNLGGVASKAELAAASYQAASAGFADTAGNVEILNAATKAAVGGLADTQAVTEVLVKTLNAYGMSGSQAFKVTDSISKAVELGNQEWSDYTSQLGRVASTAALAGVSLDEMNAFIASATKNGATAEVAFTSLSAVLTQLLQPTKESQTAAAKLGIQWNLMGLQTKGLGGLMRELAIAIDKDKEAAARMVGPTEAMRGAFAAASKDGSDFRMILAEIGNATGKTDADFQTMKGSVENTLKALDTSFKNLSEALLKAFGPTVVITLQDITKGVNGFASAMNAIPQPVMNATGEVIKLGIQMALLYKAFQGFIALRTAFIAAVAPMTTAVAASGTAAATSSGAFALYANNTKTVAASAASATPQVTALGTALRSIAAIGAIAVTIDIAIKGAVEAFNTLNELNRLRGERTQPGGYGASFGGSATAQQKEEQRKIVARLQNQSLMEKGGLTLQGLAIAPQGLMQLQNLPLRLQLADQQLKKAQAILALPTRAAAPAPRPPAGGGGIMPSGVPSAGGGGGGANRGAADAAAAAAKAAAEEQARVAQVIRERLAEGQIIRLKSEMQDRITAAEAAGDKMLATRLKGQEKALDIQYRYAQQLTQEKDIRAQEALIYVGNTELVASQREVQRELNELQRQGDQDRLSALQKAIEKQYELNTGVQNQIQLANGVADAIGQGMGSAFSALISGAQSWEKSLQQIASGVLVDIANQLIRIFIIEQAVNAIKTFLSPAAPTSIGAGGGMIGNLGTFGPNYGIPQRAQGGSVTAGQPYLVGERGPELFMPGRSGGIAPTGSFGGAGVNVTVNVTTGGSSVQGDQTQGRQLGIAVAAAVQSELIKQKRPGGLLA